MTSNFVICDIAFEFFSGWWLKRHARAYDSKNDVSPKLVGGSEGRANAVCMKPEHQLSSHNWSLNMLELELHPRRWLKLAVSWLFATTFTTFMV